MKKEIDDISEQTTEAQGKKKQQLQDNTHPLSPTTKTLTLINHPHLPHPPIVYNNNTMDIEFPVQIRQSNKCGNVRINEIFTLHLGFGVGH